MTVMANSTGVELVAKGKAGQGFTKAPKGRHQSSFLIANSSLHRIVLEFDRITRFVASALNAS